MVRSKQAINLIDLIFVCCSSFKKKYSSKIQLNELKNVILQLN